MASCDVSPKAKTQKALSWKLPEDNSEVEISENLLLAERLSSAVRDSIHELLPSALRCLAFFRSGGDATATTLQKLSVVTLKMSNFLDRMEMQALDASVTEGSSCLNGPMSGAMSPRSMNSLGLLDKPKPTVASVERTGCWFDAREGFATHLSVPGDSGCAYTYSRSQQRHRDGRQDAQGGVGARLEWLFGRGAEPFSVFSDEIFLPIPVNTPRRSIDESAAGSFLGASGVSSDHLKMGMKSLETRLARELFKTAKKQRTKGFSWAEDCSLSALSRQNSKAKLAGENVETEHRQAPIRRGLSRESLGNSQSLASSWSVLRGTPQAPANKPLHPEVPSGVVPEMPGGPLLPAIPSQDLDDGKKEVSGRTCTDPQLAEGTPKRNVPTHTSRSKKGSVQLRDANNDELIRATIKSVNKIAPLSEIEPFDATVETGFSEEDSEAEVGQIRFPWLRADAWLTLRHAGKKAVTVISLLNCSASVCDSRLVTLLFQGVLMLTCLLAVGWSVTNVILQYIAMQENAGLHSYFFYDVALAFGALLSLLCGGCLRFSTPVPWNAEGWRSLHEDWLSKCRWDALLVLIIWVLSVVERTREVFADGSSIATLQLQQDVDQQELVYNLCNLGSFAVSGAVLLSCLFRIMRVCRGFYVIIDDFSFNLVTTSDLCVAEQDRPRSCHSLQYLFIVLQSTIVAALILGVDDFYRLNKPTLLISGASPKRLGFGRSLDADRLYLVENGEFRKHYVFDLGQAGFYIFEVRVTRDMVLKAFYISGMAIFYFATKEAEYFQSFWTLCSSVQAAQILQLEWDMSSKRFIVDHFHASNRLLSLKRSTDLNSLPTNALSIFNQSNGADVANAKTRAYTAQHQC
eukprot:s855_g17.t1